jgi:hypothetical protein
MEESSLHLSDVDPVIILIIGSFVGWDGSQKTRVQWPHLNRVTAGQSLVKKSPGNILSVTEHHSSDSLIDFLGGRGS